MEDSSVNLGSSANGAESLAQKARPPLYFEAVEYCDERGLVYEDDLERVRTMLAVREFMRRIEPLQKRAADLMALQPVKFITSEGYVRADLTAEMDAIFKGIQALIDREADALGLTVPALASDTVSVQDEPDVGLRV